MVNTMLGLGFFGVLVGASGIVEASNGKEVVFGCTLIGLSILLIGVGLLVGARRHDKDCEDIIRSIKYHDASYPRFLRK